MLVLAAKFPVFAKLFAERKRGDHSVVPRRGYIIPKEVGELAAHEGDGGDSEPTLKQLLLVGQLGSIGAAGAGGRGKLVSDDPKVTAEGCE